MIKFGLVVVSSSVIFLQILAAVEGNGENNAATVLISLIGLVLFVALLIFFFQLLAKQRTEKLQRIADRLMFSFFPKDENSLLKQLDHFHFFSRGRSKKISNILQGKIDAVELTAFDYRYVTGSGKHSRRHLHSVIFFTTPFNLPKFSVRPEGVFHKIGSTLGYQDIDFETHPQFSKYYLLRGENESAVRELFKSELLSFIESQKKLSIEGATNQLIFYRKRKKPEQIQELMTEGMQVFEQFRALH